MKEKFLQLGESTVYLDRYVKILASHSCERRFRFSEGHHIFPKFVFGENNELRYVSFRVHFLLHELLWRHFKKIGKKTLANKAAYPLVRMSGKNASSQNRSGVRFSSRAFEAAKRANIEALSGTGNPMFGKKHAPETIEAMSRAKKGRPMSEEQKQKMRGRKMSEEAVQRMKNAVRPKASPEECAARSERMKAVWARRKAEKR